MRYPWLLLPLLASCTAEPVEVRWLESAGYRWSAFNHRLSFLSLMLDGDVARLGVVGGASSTGWVPDLPAGCDETTCDEYPFYDSTEVDLTWARTLLESGGAGTTLVTTVATARPPNAIH